MTNATNINLWNKIKKKHLNAEPAGKWNARKAQLTVKEYKAAGGKFKGSQANTSLAKWTQEKWQYYPPGQTSGRYLPKAVWDQLTPKQVKETNKNKRQAGKGKKVPYEKFIIEAFKSLK